MSLAMDLLEKLAARGRKKAVDPSKEEEKALAARAQQGDSFAMRTLVRRLEGTIRKVQRERFSGVNQPEDVMYQELVRLTQEAVMNYDPTRGANLNTHVTNYIYSKGLRFLNRYNNVAKQDEKEFFLIGPIESAIKDLSKDGISPSNEQIVRWIKVNDPERKNVTLENVKNARERNRKEIISSTQLKSGEGGMTFGDIANTNRVDPNEELQERIRMDAVRSAMNQLPEMHQNIVKHKEGLFGFPKLNNAEIAMQYNLPSVYQVTKIHGEAKGMLMNNIRKMFGNDDDDWE